MAANIKRTYDTSDMTLTSAEILKAVRRHRGLSQSQLGIYARATQGAVSRWENNAQSISSDRLFQVLERLHFQPVLLDYQQSSLRATLTIQVIGTNELPPQMRQRLERMSREELIQVIAWQWVREKESWNR